MHQQTDFDKPIEIGELRWHINAGENDDEGGFRTHNPENNKWQRRYIHLADKKSKFKKTVEMVLCVHGWETPSHEQAMTLLVFRLHFTCSDAAARYKSATVWFEFGNYDEKDKGNESSTSAKANPDVVAYGPFNKTARWDKVKAELKRKITLGGEAGVDYMANAKLNASGEWEISYPSSFFHQGTANPILNDNTGITEGVEWNLKGKELPDNYSQSIEPDLLIAILLKRNTLPGGEPIPFTGTFDMRLKAGLWEDISQGVQKIFVPWKLTDEAIYFNPAVPDHVYGEDGKRCLALVDRENLGTLASDEMLVGLCSFPGLGAVTSKD